MSFDTGADESSARALGDASRPTGRRTLTRVRQATLCSIRKIVSIRKNENLPLTFERNRDRRERSRTLSHLEVRYYSAADLARTPFGDSAIAREM